MSNFEEWKSLARSVLREFVATRDTFVACELTDEIIARAKLAGLPDRDNRAVGPIIRGAENIGLIERTNKLMPSTRVNGRGSMLWRSANPVRFAA
jgi:hypothetical protein